MLLLFICCRVCAQYVDDHNPVGVSGIFNGNIQTGCSYDPLTHSALRGPIDDIVVAGCIGKYPLKMTRYYNSRRFRGTPGLGPGWSHEYSWSLHSDIGKIEYPNGNAWENHCETPVGVSDWLGPNDPRGNPTFRLADGGTVVFNGLGQPIKIIDPYGQTTTISYTTFTMTVTEPGGRYLLFTHFSEGPKIGLLSKVEAFDGRGTSIERVNYEYTLEPGGGTGPDQWCLTRVSYADDTSATYTYEPDNVPEQPLRGSFKFWPLLSTANDTRYHGPMRRVAYDYENHGPHGAISAERYSPGDGVKGMAVSSIEPPLPSPLSGGQGFQMPTDFSETRGDGNCSRTFHYTELHIHRRDEPVCPDITGGPPTQMLLNYTDFQQNTIWLQYDANWYVNKVTDARGAYSGDPAYTTSYTRGPAPPQGIGQIRQMTHPDGHFVKYDYEHPTPQNPDPHYVTRITDERGNVTKHFRDAKHRIYRTEYRSPGGNDSGALLASEEFTYCDQVDPQCSNNPLGQIKSHLLKNGAYVHYGYDSRGLLIDKWEPTWNANAVNTEPKTHYDYYAAGPWTDRVRTMTLPANASGLQASETYEYDKDADGNRVAGRGLVTTITHNDANNTYKSFGYNSYGNKLWEENELRERTSYTYDEYNRVRTVKDPIGQTTGRTTTYTYNPTNGGGSPYEHTTSNPDSITTAANIRTDNIYDQNFRRISTSIGGQATWFHYDPTGNQDWVTDPRGTAGRTYPNGDPAYTTYTDYDSRDRKSRIREPLGRTTQFFYEDGINVTRIIRPDQTTATKTYDGMNRLRLDTVPKTPGDSITTEFRYYPSNVRSAGLLNKVIDGENHVYQFEYDPSGLKTKVTYPDSSYRTWTYDAAHNLESRTTVAGETQNFAYDVRNRKIGDWWDGFPADAEWRVYDYDDANRLTLATNGTGAYWSNFIADVRRSYDDAGRLTLDQQTVYVNGAPITYNVNYPSHDDDGKLLRMYVAGVNPSYDYTFTYDSMGRFEKIFTTGQGNPFFQYHYDLASNEIQRDNLHSGVSQKYPRDALNRLTKVLLQGMNSAAREVYDYDSMGRLHTVTRQNNLQDQFDYFLDGELKQATYDLSVTPSPTPPRSPTPMPTPTSTPTPLPGQVAPPTFDPDGADYVACAINYTFNVTISTTTNGARIRWTIDGSHWMDMENGGIAAFVVGVNQTKTLQAYGYKPGMQNSSIHAADYIFERECAGSPMASGIVGPTTYPLDMVSNYSSQGIASDSAGTVTYDLDKAGNRRSVNGTSYIPNSINQYTSVGGDAVTNGNDHEIRTYYGFTFAYMRDQELTRISAPGLTYDVAYDALGRCVKRTFNGTITTYYIYDGDKPILEYHANGGLVGFNLYGKGVDEIIERGAHGTDNQWHWYFLQQDHEGSVSYVTDSAGTVIEKYRYDAFGAPTFYDGRGRQIPGSAYNNRFLFTGREYAGAWVYEYRARLYHSGLGRFMSEDPKLFDPGDYNLFRYCHNDPADLTDPMGTQGDHPDPWPTHLRQGLEIDITIAERISLWQKSMETSLGGEMAAQMLQTVTLSDMTKPDKGTNTPNTGSRRDDHAPATTAVFSRQARQIVFTLPNGDTIVYPAANNTLNPCGDPNRVDANGSAPNGTFPVQRVVSMGESQSYGPYFYPIGAVGPHGERLDIARQRGIGLHAGRDSYLHPTHGCIRMNNQDIVNLQKQTQNAPLEVITIGE